VTKTEQIVLPSAKGLDKQDYQEVFGILSMPYGTKNKARALAADKSAARSIAPAAFLMMVLTLAILLLTSP